MLGLALLALVLPAVMSHDCTCGGDPFYKTVDGEILEFQGKCNYLLMGTKRGVPLPNGLHHFRIYVDNTKAMGSERAYTKKVHIDALYHRISLRENGMLFIDDVDTTPGTYKSTAPEIQIDKAGILKAGKDGPKTYLKVANMFTIHADFRGPGGRHVVTVSDINEGYKGKLEGMCGNFNGNPADDHYPKGGNKAMVDTQIGNSWIVDNTECL